MKGLFYQGRRGELVFEAVGPRGWCAVARGAWNLGGRLTGLGRGVGDFGLSCRLGLDKGEVMRAWVRQLGLGGNWIEMLGKLGPRTSLGVGYLGQAVGRSKKGSK